MKNGIPTYNVIPASYLSPISIKMASFMPAPSNPNALANNYLGGYPSGFDNNVQDWRVDWDVNSKQRLSTVGAMGAVHYLQNYTSGGIRRRSLWTPAASLCRWHRRQHLPEVLRRRVQLRHQQQHGEPGQVLLHPFHPAAACSHRRTDPVFARDHGNHERSRRRGQH